MYVSILLPIPYCPHYCGFTIRLEISVSSKFVLFLLYCDDYSVLPFHMIFRNILSISTKTLAGVFGWGYIESYRSVWEELTSSQYRVFQFMKYLDL